eukprot:gene10199-7147_t
MNDLNSKEAQEEADKKFALQLQKEFDREIPNSRVDSNNRNRGSESSLSGVIECPTCHTKNAIPSRRADVYLCGACNKQLKKSPQQPAPIPEAFITLQVQCGQCSAVNEVQVRSNATSVQFKCGNCESINEAELE